MSIFRYLSLFSGIEAATVAWHPLGWEPVAFAEVNPAACAVLAHHYPHVPNLGDVTLITEPQIAVLGHIDIVVFGSPCQDVSVAGKRTGLKGERSGLFFDAMRIVRWSRARFALFENVPGLFSSHDGRDFAAVVGAMARLEFDVPPDGWRNTGVALGPDGLVEWSVLDAQWFGVPQRRRRIFALRDSGDWSSRPPILFERESLRGYPAPSREAGQRVAGTLEARARTGGYDPGAHGAASGHLIAFGGNNTSGSIDVASGLNAKGGAGRMDFESERFVAHSLRAEGFDASEDGTGRCIPLVASSPNGNSGGCQIEQQYIPILEVHGGSSSRGKGPNGVGIGEPGDPMFFDCKASGRNGFGEGGTSPTLRAMNRINGNANGGGQVAVAFCGMAQAGKGWVPQSCPSAEDVALTLDATRSQSVVLPKALQHTGVTHASAQEADTGTLLRTLRQEVGTEAFAQWGFGVLNSLQQAQVLQSEVHGESLRRSASDERSVVDDGSLSCTEDLPERAMRPLWEEECFRRSPQGRELPEQLARELRACLSKLPHETTQVAAILLGLWDASEGIGLLRQALSEIQEMGRPIEGEGQPVCPVENRNGEQSPAWLRCARVFWELSRKRVLQSPCSTGPQGKTNSIGGQGSAVRRLTPL